MKKPQPSQSPPAPPRPAAAPPCKIRLCRDPVTGRTIAKPEGPCPRGYVEEMIQEVQKNGLWFPPPELLDDDE